MALIPDGKHDVGKVEGGRLDRNLWAARDQSVTQLYAFNTLQAAYLTEPENYYTSSLRTIFGLMNDKHLISFVHEAMPIHGPQNQTLMLHAAILSHDTHHVRTQPSQSHYTFTNHEHHTVTPNENTTY